jgi:hypothetical protein
MAGNQNSGGFRPTAPQNNPANISATGGAGQSGKQPLRYIPGQAWGQGQATMQQEQGAKMYADAAPQQEAPVVPVTAPTQLPDQSVMHGSASGPGPSSVPNLPPVTTNDPDLNDVQRELPYMEFWASQPGASQSTKDYVAYLRTIVARPGEVG